MASAVLVTDSESFAQAVSQELEKQIPCLSRAEIARKSIDENGKIIVANDLKTVIEIANEIAPEHLELCVDDPFAYLDEIKHAGSIFMGRYCPEALGDYFAGPNHTLPTSGTARFSSALSVDDFVKKSQYIYYTESALNEVAQKVAYFAEKEGLGAHAKSAIIRTNKE
jgi:histidinol dehydrogenase